MGSNPKSKSRKQLPLKARTTPPILNWLKALTERTDDPEVMAALGPALLHPVGVEAYYRDSAVERTKDGDVGAAREVLETFALVVEATPEDEWSGPLRYAEATFLAAAFREVLSGTNAERALGLKGKVGRHQSDATAILYQAIASGFELLLRRGMSESQVTAALEVQGFSKRRIQRARAANPWVASRDAYTPALLKTLSRPIAPQIERIVGARKGR